MKYLLFAFACICLSCKTTNEDEIEANNMTSERMGEMVHAYMDNEYEDVIDENGISRKITYKEYVKSENIYYRSKPILISEKDDYSCVLFARKYNIQFKGFLDDEISVDFPLTKHEYKIIYFRKVYENGDENNKDVILGGTASPDWFNYYLEIDDKKKFISEVTSLKMYWGIDKDLEMKKEIIQALKVGGILD
ncbi:hypothetical protein OGH69_02365 [Flavobacterium sp. MFBS3-15]|uniref:hypothetical protein n=1 Tax=Flavobacterium sp. MFBS3-15 TaxID=2989816 RepID=UPI0022359D54|nr:hypothetical protein [Flavobacterium sp. MFBS3-15]MCW4467794.1 hypothetical protein [Flavobacterium sp. MFBS3-15]